MKQLLYFIVPAFLLILSCRKKDLNRPVQTPTTPILSTPTILWNKLYGGTSQEHLYSIIATADGGYMTVGMSYSNDGDVSGNHGEFDAWMMKLDANGNKQWSKLLGAMGWEVPQSMIATIDGGYIIAGYSDSNDGDVSGNHGKDDVWVMKVDANANIEWSKLFGGKDYDAAYSIIATTDGGCLVVSNARSNDGGLSGNHGVDDVWLIKLDANGNKQWDKLYGGTLKDYVYSIIATKDGGCLIVGGSESNDGDISSNHGAEDALVLKLDANGNKQWIKLFGGTGRDRAYSAIATTDGGYAIVGISMSNDGDVSGYHGVVDAWLLKLDGNGNKQWGKLYGGTEYDEFSSIIAAADGGYIIAGRSFSNNGDVSGLHGVGDAWIMKLDANGNKQVSKLYGGTLGDYANSIIATTNGHYIIAGEATSVDGDISGNHGQSDAWVMKIKIQ